MRPDANQPIFASGECEIDLARRELRVRGSLVPIGGRTFEIIEVLVKSAGELVTKDQLMSRIWPGAIVSENTLQVHAVAIRKALGPFRNLLKTESRRGYRLLGNWTLRQRDVERQPDGPLPARASSGHPITNLPASVSRLVGRDTAAQRLQDLVSAYRVVMLTGPGGIGKTTLALEVARRVLCEYSDGGWLVELASLSDQHLIPAAVAGVLGLKLDIYSAEAVAGAIGNKRLLLIFDNCEHVLDAAATFVDTCVRICPATTILATSREAFRIQGEVVYRVPPLEVPPAEQVESRQIAGHSAPELFITKANELGADFTSQAKNLPTIAAICRHLDGIPLAIEFAAARAATLGLEEVVAGLRDRFATLTNGSRRALPRHRTLRATLDWSYRLLTEGERRMLDRLAIFPGRFTFQDAQAIASDEKVSPSETLNRLANLIAKSLVTTDASGPTTGYRLLETIRAYALETLVQAGELNAVARRHAGHYLEYFEAAEAEAETRPTDDWLADYGARLNNVRAALDWAFSRSGDAEIGVALTAATIPLWMHLSLMEECRRRVEGALAACVDGVQRSARSEMQLNTALAASLMYTNGAVPEVDAAGTRALESAETLGDVEYQLRSLFGLWSFRINSGQQRIGLSLANRFHDIAEKRSRSNDGLIAERMIGTSQYLLGDLTAARCHLERVLACNDAPVPEQRIVRFEVNQRVAARSYLARILWLQGLPDQAMQAAEASVAEAHETDHAISLGLALALAACPIALFTGELAMAEQYVEALIHHSTTHALSRWQAFGRGYNAMLVMGRGDLATGLKLLLAAFDDPAGAGSVPRFFAAVMAEALGCNRKVTEGLAAVEGAIDRAELSEERWTIPELLRIKGELVLLQGASGASTEADHLFRRALDRAHGQGALSWELRCAMSLARLRRGETRRDEVTEVLASVYTRFAEGFGTADLKAAKALLEGSSPGEEPAARPKAKSVLIPTAHR